MQVVLWPPSVPWYTHEYLPLPHTHNKQIKFNLKKIYMALLQGFNIREKTAEEKRPSDLEPQGRSFHEPMLTLGGLSSDAAALGLPTLLQVNPMNSLVH